MQPLNIQIQNNKTKLRNLILSIVALALLVVVLANVSKWFGSYFERILVLGAIYSICALSMNLVNGFLGMFSLGQPGFMAIGAYVFAVLTLTPEAKHTVYYVEPIVPWLANVQVPQALALILGGILAMFAAFIIGFPVLRLKGDYLAIASLGFSEIIRIIINNMQSITNGPSGIIQVPNMVNIWVAFGVLAIIVVFCLLMMKTTYGRAFKSIRENEIAAGAMGVNLFKHKLIAFAISGFLAGIGGALLASLLATVDPNQFRYTLAFTLLLMVIIGGQGSISGSIAGAFVVTIAQEWLRVVDEPINFGFWQYPGVAGMRMVVFSVVLMLVLLFWNRGIFGQEEFSWNRLINGVKHLFSKRQQRVKKEREC